MEPNLDVEMYNSDTSESESENQSGKFAVRGGEISPPRTFWSIVAKNTQNSGQNFISAAHFANFQSGSWTIGWSSLGRVVGLLGGQGGWHYTVAGKWTLNNNNEMYSTFTRWTDNIVFLVRAIF